MFDTFDSLLYSFGGLRTIVHDPGVVLVELLLIGIAVNWCAGVLQGTRGTRPLRGVLMVLIVATLVVNTLTAQFDWPRLALLYQYLVLGLVAIALVAFQPELRRAVIRAGDVRFLRRGTPQSKFITALVQSARYLSKNRYGGLVAIQRAVDLSGWAEKGTLINAEVSANLLNTIFFPNSPLHDLGVVIRGNRVAAANVQFPVAESDEVGTALGSRHLAAVGMSYESDALVLVVSEETGTISLADNGKLVRFLSIDDLADELATRLAGRGAAPARPDGQERLPPGTRAWRLVKRMLVVVPLTLVIWMVANQRTQSEIEGVPVQIELRTSDPQRIADVAGPQPVYSVSFRGTARAVNSVRDNSREDPLRVTWLISDQYAPEVPLQRSVWELLDSLDAIRDRGLAVTRVVPPDSTLRFSVHRLATEALPVRVDPGSARAEIERIEPDRIQVTLRRQDLEQLSAEQRVVLLPLERELRGVAPGEEVTRQVPVPERIGGFLVVSTDRRQIQVTLRLLGEQLPPRRVPQVPVLVQASPEFLQRYEVVQLDPQEWLIEVEIEGEPEALAALTPQDVHAFVRLSSDLVPAATPEFRRDVEFSVPPGLRVLSQRSVQVRVVRREEAAP